MCQGYVKDICPTSPYPYQYMYNLGQKYIDSASNLLNNPLPFHPITMLAQGVYLASNAQKQQCLRGERDL